MQKVELALILVLFFVVAFPIGHPRDLWEPDEPRFAQVAREMIETGDFVMPHRNGNPYPDKPPFYFWTIALSGFVAGSVTPSAALIPTAVAGVMTILLTFLLALRLTGDRRLALMSAVILATTVKIYWQASHAQIDMVLTCLTTFSLYLMILWEQEDKNVWLILAWAVMGIAVLTKGPVGLIIPLGSMLVYRKWADRGKWRRLFPYAGLTAFVLVVGSWLVLLIYQGVSNGETAYLQNILFKQNVVRFANSWHHHQPVYYFMKVILHDSFPWTAFLVALILTRWPFRNLDEKERFVFSIIFFTMIFFSIPMGKRGLYILPLYPAVAIGIAMLLHERVHERAVGIASRFTAVILILTGLALVITWRYSATDVPPVTLGYPGVAVLGGGVWLWFRKSRPLLPVVFCMFVLTGFMGYVVNPAINGRNSARDFVRHNMQIIGPDAQLAIAQFRSAHVYYGDRNLIEFGGQEEEDNLVSFVSYLKEHPRAFGILSWKNTEFLQGLGVPVVVCNREMVGHKDLCLVQVTHADP